MKGGETQMNRQVAWTLYAAVAAVVGLVNEALHFLPVDYSWLVMLVAAVVGLALVELVPGKPKDNMLVGWALTAGLAWLAVALTPLGLLSYVVLLLVEAVVAYLLVDWVVPTVMGRSASTT